MNIKKIISKQKSIARKNIAAINLRPLTSNGVSIASNDRAFLKLNFSKIQTLESLMSAIHNVRHKGISKAGKYTRCKICRAIMTEIQMEPNEVADILPKFGNLLAVLEKEVAEERNYIEVKRTPSSNDLTRWALKDAVLAYYQGLNMPAETPIVESRYDDRLVDDLAPDFDVIANIWLQKLDELKRRNDRYTLNLDEFDKAEADLNDGMRGSAFEKQLDRFREEFMKKLPR